MFNHDLQIELCGDVLHSNYECCLYTLGYEQRSTYIARRYQGRANRRVALGYQDFQLFSYQDNKTWYTGNGFDVIECSDSDFRINIEQIVAEMVGDSRRAVRVLVDISSMNRFRLASLVDVFRNVQGIRTIRVDFVYCLAEYSPPPRLTFVNRHAGPVAPQFSGWWSEPDLPTAAIVGVGYEQDKALGAIEHIQPSEVWLFFPRSPVAEYTSALNYANKSLIDKVTGFARVRLPHGLKLDDLELSCPVLIGGSGSVAFSLPDPIPDTKRLELHEVQPPAAARAREICR